MIYIPFSTAVNYGPNATSLTDILLEKVDDYFFLGGKKAQVILGAGTKIGNSQGTLYIHKQSPLYVTVLKIVSYCTVIIPVVVCIVKTILRSIYQFHLHPSKKENSLPPTVIVPPLGGPGGPNIPPNKPPSDDSDKEAQNQVFGLEDDDYSPKDKVNIFKMDALNIPFDVHVQLSVEQVVKLHLKAMVELAHTSPKGDVMPVCNKAISNLFQYKDSFFYFEKIEHSGDYLIERKKNDGSCPLNTFKSKCELKYDSKAIISSDEFMKLGLDPLSFEFCEKDNCVSGRSSLPKYKNVKFTWKETMSNGHDAIEIKGDFLPE